MHSSIQGARVTDPPTVGPPTDAVSDSPSPTDDLTDPPTDAVSDPPSPTNDLTDPPTDITGLPTDTTGSPTSCEKITGMKSLLVDNSIALRIILNV